MDCASDVIWQETQQECAQDNGNQIHRASAGVSHMITLCLSIDEFVDDASVADENYMNGMMNPNESPT